VIGIRAARRRQQSAQEARRYGEQDAGEHDTGRDAEVEGDSLKLSIWRAGREAVPTTHLEDHAARERRARGPGGFGS
jgi:hypothetical protein